MATFTPELSPKTNKKGESSVRIRVTAQGDTSRIGCGFRIDRNDWNPKKGIVRASHPNHKILNQRISEKLAEVQAKSLTGQGAFAITKQINNESFFKFAYDFIEQFNNSDQFNTFRSYETKLNKIRKFTAPILSSLILQQNGFGTMKPISKSLVMVKEPGGVI